MTPRETAIKRIIDGGGTWPPAKMPITAWVDTGRWRSLPCRSCGGACDPDRRWCEHCGEVQP